jgi:hypothetical protein
VHDVLLVEQRLRLQIIEDQPHATHILALQEIGIAVGAAIARARPNRPAPNGPTNGAEGMTGRLAVGEDGAGADPGPESTRTCRW